MLYNKIKMVIYTFFINTLYGYKLKKANSNSEKKELHIEYSQKILTKLNIEVKVKNREKLPTDGQFLLISNHRSIIDPLIVEMALEKTNIFGIWVSKKELTPSLFIGSLIKNGGTVLLDKENKNLSYFFKEIKTYVDNGDSIFIFPEGTRNRENTQLLHFKRGAKLIALKNKLSILPICIRTNAHMALQSALQDNKPLEVEVEIGDVIDCKTKTEVEKLYRDMFKLEG